MVRQEVSPFTHPRPGPEGQGASGMSSNLSLPSQIARVVTGGQKGEQRNYKDRKRSSDQADHTGDNERAAKIHRIQLVLCTHLILSSFLVPTSPVFFNSHCVIVMETLSNTGYRRTTP